mmetsp:Transcript_19156/g.47837  ORF Transcript_19156/g.47837 Transcript_19156/m.47837 type:complete len:357 (+) Transcript_19156:622-1692(+)
MSRSATMQTLEGAFLLMVLTTTTSRDPPNFTRSDGNRAPSPPAVNATLLTPRLLAESNAVSTHAHDLHLQGLERDAREEHTAARSNGRVKLVLGVLGRRVAELPRHLGGGALLCEVRAVRQLPQPHCRVVRVEPHGHRLGHAGVRHGERHCRRVPVAVHAAGNGPHEGRGAVSPRVPRQGALHHVAGDQVAVALVAGEQVQNELFLPLQVQPHGDLHAQRVGLEHEPHEPGVAGSSVADGHRSLEHAAEVILVLEPGEARGDLERHVVGGDALDDEQRHGAGDYQHGLPVHGAAEERDVDVEVVDVECLGDHRELGVGLDHAPRQARVTEHSAARDGEGGEDSGAGAGVNAVLLGR